MTNNSLSLYYIVVDTDTDVFSYLRFHHLYQSLLDGASHALLPLFQNYLQLLQPDYFPRDKLSMISIVMP